MNIFIVEDSAPVRDQLARLLTSQERLRLAGWAADEESAVAAILANPPDAVLLDIALAPGSGLNVLRRIREAGCSARVLVLSHNTGAEIRAACEDLGISGFHDKGGDPRQVLMQILEWLPPLPGDEPRRLAALASTALLDSPEDEVFEGLVRLARDITGAPMAAISLVDRSRQWFLARSGIALGETSRSIAFCAHAILENKLMEVPDALADERFRDNPLVAGGPRLRHYTGMPLVLHSGETLGALCVLDTQPGRIDEGQREALKTLARGVVAEIELRRRVGRLQEEVKRREAAEARITQLATRDPLTGLPNRNVFRDRLGHELRQAARRGGVLATMYIDLDRFKLVNDTLGHEVGDRMLLTASQRLAGALREADTVSRLGGDEFAVILPEVSAHGEAMLVAHKLLHALAVPFESGGRRLHIDASIGIACFPRDGETAEDLLRHADLAMYQSKALGGNRATQYAPEFDAQASAALALDNDLLEAIEERHLTVEFQPRAALDAHRIGGFEALVRWDHPRLGRLAPERFIPLAVERGWVHRIDRHVMDRALGQLATWDRAGLRVPRVSVNLAPCELRAGLPVEVDHLVRNHGLTPDRLEIEITETAIAGDGAAAIRVLDELRRKGYSVAIDDFGAGHSSLGHLRRLPADVLKIARSLIETVHLGPADAALVGAVVAMAGALGLSTVAEGVEHPAQVEALARLGCDGYQGYLLARPMAAAEVPGWLARHAPEGIMLASSAQDV